MKLLVIESPGKQKTIQKYLGEEWKVVASLGHIRGLEQNLEFLQRDFEPKYEFIKEKAKAIKELKEKAKDADEIYLAADKDFEGEQIAYSVCLLLKLNPLTAKRVTFTEITEKAINYAIQHPGIIDMDKVNTQKTRAIMDMLIGFTMSPLLWRYVAPSLSAGRCQTPALRLVIERERLIQNFQSTSSWRFSSIWQYSNQFRFPAIMDDELEDEESVINHMENIHLLTEGTILSKHIRPWSEKAPDPLITSTLQQQVSAIFHINPKNTMKIAQRLYEAGHITYMRTDQPVLSEDAVIAAKKWIIEQYGEKFVEDVQKPKKKSKAKEDAEVKAQEAHEAIRPTHMEQTELPEGDWSAVDIKIYHLIWQRTIQSVMSPAQGELCTMKCQINNDDCTWSSSWRRTLFEGWKQVGKVASIEEEEEESDEDSKEDAWNKMMDMKVGEVVQWKEIKAEPKETKAHGRFTEATLVRELEKFGIGRPSTFASLLSVIQEKGYVEPKDIPAKDVMIKEYTLTPGQWPTNKKEYKKKMGAEKNKLVPTDLGYSVMDFILQHFHDLFDYGFTAQMEKRLDRIAVGQEPWKNVLRDMWQSYKDRYDNLLSKQLMGGESNAKVKEFTAGLKAVQSKKGPLLLLEGDKKEDTIFLGWPKGVRFDDMTEEVARAFEQEVKQKKEGDAMGEWKGQVIMKKTGKFGEYLQCGDLSVPYQVGEELEKTIERLETKANGGTGVIKQFKEFVIRSGPYGPYIMKMSLKKAQFVSVPKGIDVTILTEKDVDALYKSGLESKKKWKSAQK